MPPGRPPLRMLVTRRVLTQQQMESYPTARQLRKRSGPCQVTHLHPPTEFRFFAGAVSTCAEN